MMSSIVKLIQSNYTSMFRAFIEVMLISWFLSSSRALRTMSPFKNKTKNELTNIKIPLNMIA